eukprot:6808328-Prymnesium_polylepis.1
MPNVQPSNPDQPSPNAQALENLAADNEENAAAVVEAAVVPAMKELLVGRGAANLSQKAARKVAKGPEPPRGGLLNCRRARHHCRACPLAP